MKLYLVGGFLRNYLIKEPSKDVDFVIYGSFKEVERFGNDIGGKVFRLGAEHDTFRIMLPKQYSIESLDFSFMQGETIVEDLGKRDFTINAMALDLSQIVMQKGLIPFLKEFISNPVGFLDSYNLSNDLIDPYLGILAVKRKELKMVSEIAYKNDPLRILRGIRLSADLGLTLTLATLNKMRLDATLLGSVAGERIREELFGVLRSDRSYEYIELLDKLGLLKTLWPKLESLARVKQNNHHRVDAWMHCKLTLKALEEILNSTEYLSEEMRDDVTNYLDTKVAKNVTKRQLLKLAAIFHDLGKLTTGQVRSEKITFYGHDKVGAELFNEIGRRIKLSTKELNLAKKLIYFHMRPLLLSLQVEITDKALYRLMVGLKDDVLGVFILSMADFKSKTDIKGLDQENLQYHVFIYNLINRVKHLQAKEKEIEPISGQEVLRIDPYISAKRIGSILNAVRESQIVGKVKNREEALLLLSNLIKKV